MPKTSYAETMNSVKVMLAGLKANAERVAKRGLDTDFVTNLESAYASAQVLDNEQESLKAELKKKTDQLNNEIANLKKLLAEARKIVKIEMEQSSWMEFGIAAKS